MHKLILIALLSLILQESALCQNSRKVKIAEIELRLKQPDTLFIINFWATWCPPCIAELPEFNRVDSAWKGKPVKVILVSLDFPEAWPEKLNEFLRKKHILQEVLWLDESDANAFIPKISTTWTGAIPATLISYNTTKYRVFKEDKINFIFLDEQIKSGIKKQ